MAVVITNKLTAKLGQLTSLVSFSTCAFLASPAAEAAGSSNARFFGAIELLTLLDLLKTTAPSSFLYSTRLQLWHRLQYIEKI